MADGYERAYRRLLFGMREPDADGRSRHASSAVFGDERPAIAVN
jgi:hypothetical protein